MKLSNYENTALQWLTTRVNKENCTLRSTDLHKYVYDNKGIYQELKSFHRAINPVISDGADFAPCLD